MKKAVIIAFDQFTDIDIFLPWDLLNRVKTYSPDFEIKIVGTDQSHVSSTGLKLEMHGLIEECASADLVIFGSGIGTRALINDEAYLKRISINTETQLICSLCTGSLILGAKGILKGLRATTYPTAFHLLAGYGANVIESEALIVEGNIATAAECLAAVDLMGWAIERLFGKEISKAVLDSVTPNGQNIPVPSLQFN
jgi:transcriptional regulator GlxA family with amidase domain